MQTDGLIIDPFEFSFFDYDYVGAPCSINKHFSKQFKDFSNDLTEELLPNWETYSVNRNFSSSFGNGGVSIRNTEIMKLISSNETCQKSENEDMFFSRFLRKYNSKLY